MKLMKMIVTAFVVTSAYTAQAAKIHVKNVDAKDRLGNSISTVYLDYSVQCGPSGYYGERVAVKNGETVTLDHYNCDITGLRIYDKETGGSRIDGDKGSVKWEQLNGKSHDSLAEKSIGGNMENWTFKIVAK